VENKSRNLINARSEKKNAWSSMNQTFRSWLMTKSHPTGDQIRRGGTPAPRKHTPASPARSTEPHRREPDPRSNQPPANQGWMKQTDGPATSRPPDSSPRPLSLPPHQRTKKTQGRDEPPLPQTAAKILPFSWEERQIFLFAAESLRVLACLRVRARGSSTTPLG
jgi:hypothetical protein